LLWALVAIIEYEVYRFVAMAIVILFCRTKTGSFCDCCSVWRVFCGVQAGRFVLFGNGDLAEYNVL
jgi:hypothetical protein